MMILQILQNQAFNGIFKQWEPRMSESSFSDNNYQAQEIPIILHGHKTE
jgi:hypothetical protein